MTAIVHRYFLPANEVFKANPFDRLTADSWSLWLLDVESRTLVCHGDYGTWAFSWGPAPIHERKEFRQELLDFGNDYIAGKLSATHGRNHRDWLGHIKTVTLPRLKAVIKADLATSGEGPPQASSSGSEDV